MILDIDIRVSSDNGVQIHQFTKHFDSRFEGKAIGKSNSSHTKQFEEFLAEFLSSSGRVIRNQLITTNPISKEQVKDRSDSYENIEYTLKLGDSQCVSGKIPLDKLIYLNEITKRSNTDKDCITTETNSPSFLWQSNLKAPQILEEVDQMFQQLITTAVNKYEDSFYIPASEESAFLQSS